MIKEKLTEQFDRVVWMLEKDAGMKITATLAEQILMDHQAVEGWPYQGATIHNLPWTFAYKWLCGRVITDKDFAAELCRACSELIYMDKRQINTPEVFISLFSGQFIN